MLVICYGFIYHDHSFIAFFSRIMLNKTVLGSSGNNSTLILTISTTTTVPQEQIELCIRNPYYQKVVIILFIVAIVLSISENVSMWIAFCYNPSLRTRVNAYFISLSVSDFFTAVTLALMETYYVWDYPYWVFAEAGTFIINSFWCLSLVTPFVHVSIITIDRYKAVISPTLHRRSWRKDLSIIAAMWVYSLGIVILMALYFSPAPGYEYQWNVLPEWYYPFIGVHILLPLVLCSILYLLIYQAVRNSKKNLEKFQMTNKEFKFALTIGIIIILLYLVWLPVIGMEVVYALWAHTCTVAQVGTISVWLTCTSGAINPIIFLSKNKKFRQTIFTMILCRNHESAILSRSSTAVSTSHHVNKGFSNDLNSSVNIKE